MREQIGLALIDAINSIKNSDLLTGATLLAFAGSIIAMVWTYGRRIIDFVYGRIKRLVVFKITLEHFDKMYWYLEVWLSENHSIKYRNVIGYLGEGNSDDPPPIAGGPNQGIDPQAKVVKYKHNADFIIVKHGGRRIFITKSRDKNENARDMTNLFYDSFYLSALFGKRKLRLLLDEVLQYNLAKVKNVPKITIYTWINNYWRTTNSVLPKTVDGIFLNGNIKELLVFDISEFIKSEEFYTKRGIPYKRGYLFHGVPGNGKTTLALALALKFKRDIFSINISGLTDDNALIDAFSEIHSNSILLIEDIDAMFTTKRGLKKDKVNFSTLLNCLDGAYYKHGLIYIMTTNHLEKLDEYTNSSMKFQVNYPLPY